MPTPQTHVRDIPSTHVMPTRSASHHGLESKVSTRRLPVMSSLWTDPVPSCIVVQAAAYGGVKWRPLSNLHHVIGGGRRFETFRAGTCSHYTARYKAQATCSACLTTNRQTDVIRSLCDCYTDETSRHMPKDRSWIIAVSSFPGIWAGFDYHRCQEWEIQNSYEEGDAV